ncbi:hypothetical protein PS870_03165 [Pseudomonas fluorescens]|uniref:Uncharacterized protein n=1 Tax=Pseudomonas fluorescens TaxID=294 RepID=A0A5E7L8A7_PSEFL|nr:hypothetical protein [Pseudomonas fluorescens]VVP08067.1 hypothetical protein PS870_03165 [Pseudomonas fluorescens]
MKNIVPNPTLDNAVIQANISKGFMLTTPDGKPAQLAVIDENGSVLIAGADVAWAAWRVCIEVQENFWEGQGHLIVHTKAP